MSIEPEVSASVDAESRPRKRRLFLKISLALLLLIGVVVALAPTIAGKIAPGVIASSIEVPGQVEVGGASFGWFSSQEIGPIVIREKDAKAGDAPVATFSIKVAKGIAGLVGSAFGSFDVGVVDVTGSADIVRYADGTTNFEKAFGSGIAAASSNSSGSSSSSNGGRIPSSLNATLNMTKLRVTYTDEASPGGPAKVSLDDGTITATVSGASGGSAVLNFSAKASQGGSQGGVGTIAGTLKASGWVKSNGTLAGDQALIDGNIALSDVPSTLVDAFAHGLPGDATLATTLGPTINLTATMKGSAKGGGGAGSSAGRVDASILVQTANLHADGEFALADKVLQLSKPLEVRLKGDAVRAVVPQVEKVMASEASASNVRLSSLSDVVLKVDSLRTPLDLSKTSMDLRGASIDWSVGMADEMRGTVVMKGDAGGKGREFVAGALTLRVTATDLAKGVTVKGGTSVTIGDQPGGELVIDLLAKNLLDSRGAFVAGIPVITGGVRLTGVSTELAQPFVGGSGLELAEDLGPTLDLAITARTDIPLEAVGGGGGKAVTGSIGVHLHAQRAALEAQAIVSSDMVKVQSMQASLGVPPATLERLSSGDVRLTEPVVINVGLGQGGLTIPLKDGMPDPRHATPLELAISATNFGVDGLKLVGSDGTAKDLGRVGVSDVSATIRAELGGLLPDPGAIPGTMPKAGGLKGKAQVEMSGMLLGPSGKTLGRLRASGSAPFRSGFLDDAVKVGVALEGLSPEVAQSILPAGTMTPGMLAGALGSSVGVSVDAAITTPGKDIRNLDVANATAKLVVRVTGDHVSTVQPMALDVLKDRVMLTSPGELRLAVDPAWVNAALLTGEAQVSAASGDGGAGSGARALTLLEPATVVAALYPVTIARPIAASKDGSVAEVGPLKPGVFEFGMDLRLPRLVMKQADGKRLEIVNLDIKGAHPPEATDGTINAAVTGKFGAAGSGVAPAKLADFNLAISVSRVCTTSGVVQASDAFMNVSGDLPGFPSSLLDLFAHEKGTIAEFIGDRADIRVRAQNISLARAGEGAPASPLGKALLDVSVTSPRVTFTTAGAIEDNAYVASAPIEIEVREVTPKAGAFINAALPALGTIEKRGGTDRPAKVTVTGFRYPLDSTYQRLEGSFDIDPGEARFESSTAFGEILKVVKAHTEGEIGQKLAPLTLAIVKGEIAIPKYDLRLGEFTIGTEGSINIATRSVNVVTWIPFGALSDKVAGTVMLNTGLGSAIGRVLPIENLTMIPFRTKGTFAKTGTSLDVELMGKSIVDTVRPDKVIERLPGLLDHIIPNVSKRKGPEAPPPEPAPTPPPK